MPPLPVDRRAALAAALSGRPAPQMAPTVQSPANLGHVLPVAAGALAAATAPRRPRLVLAVDATASREPAWAAAKAVTDSLFTAVPGELDVALAVHGGGKVACFTPFTANPVTLRDAAAAVTCKAGPTRLLSILDVVRSHAGVKVVVYIGDVLEEDVDAAMALADALKARGTRLIILHDRQNDESARECADVFAALAGRTGGCVLPFDATAPGRLRDVLAAAAVLAVGGPRLLAARAGAVSAAPLLLASLPPC